MPDYTHWSADTLILGLPLITGAEVPRGRVFIVEDHRAKMRATWARQPQRADERFEYLRQAMRDVTRGGQP